MSRAQNINFDEHQSLDNIIKSLQARVDNLSARCILLTEENEAMKLELDEIYHGDQV